MSLLVPQLDAIRAILDPTLDPGEIDEQIRDLFSMPPSALPSFSAREIYDSPAAMGQVMTLWPEYYDARDLHWFLKRVASSVPWSGAGDDRSGGQFPIVLFAMFNPQFAVPTWMRTVVQSSVDATRDITPRSAFWLEGYFRLNPNAPALLVIEQNPDFWLILAAMVMQPLAGWLENAQARLGRSALLDLVQQWLQSSPIAKFRMAGESLAGLRKNKQKYSAQTSESYLADIANGNLDEESSLVVFDVPKALDHSSYLRSRKQWGRWYVTTLLLRALVRQEVGWSLLAWSSTGRLPDLETFVRWYALASAEMSRLAELLGVPWSPPLETVL